MGEALNGASCVEVAQIEWPSVGQVLHDDHLQQQLLHPVQLQDIEEHEVTGQGEGSVVASVEVKMAVLPCGGILGAVEWVLELMVD